MTTWYFIASEDDVAEDEDGILGTQHLVCEAAVKDFKAAEDEDMSAGTVIMRCVPYGEEGQHWRGTVQFQAGCFEDSLKDLESGEERAYIQANGHWSDTLEIVANSASQSDRGTVEFTDEKDGLYAEVRLANTSAGRDIYELVSSEVITKCSVGVYIERYTAEKPDPDSYEENVTITKAILDETSFVPRPRFEKAEVKVKQGGGHKKKNSASARPAGHTIKLDVDTTGLDEALVKMKELIALEKEHKDLTHEEAEEIKPRGLALLPSLAEAEKEAS